MSAGPARRSLLRDLAFAFGASVTAAAATAALGLVVDGPAAVRGVLAGLGLACLLRTLALGRVRDGRLSAVVLFAAGTAIAWLLAPHIPAFAVALLAMLWLARALVLARSVGDAAIDLAFVAAGAAFAAWAAVRTGSLGLAVWCLLLALAISACRLLRDPRHGEVTGSAFAAALRAGEDALTRLAAERH